MERICVSRDDRYHEAWPSICIAGNGDLICSYAEADVHGGGSVPSAIVRRSSDLGRTWSAPIVVDTLMDGPANGYFMARAVVALSDGTLLLGCDWYDRTFTPPPGAEHNWSMDPENGVFGEVWLYRSDDHGVTWRGPQRTGRLGWSMNLGVLDDGRIYISGSFYHSVGGRITQVVYFSDDDGATWSEAIPVVDDPRWSFAEGDIADFGDDRLVMYLRCEGGPNPGRCGFKAISTDGGRNWQGPYAAGRWPVVGRINAGRLSTGEALVVHRIGGFTLQRMFGFYLESAETALSPIPPAAGGNWGIIDNDTSPYADYGYGDWAELSDGSIFAVNYIVGDAPKNRPHINGYRLSRDELLGQDDVSLILFDGRGYERGKLAGQRGWIRQHPDFWFTRPKGPEADANLGNYIVVDPGSAELRRVITGSRNIGGGEEVLRHDLRPVDLCNESLTIRIVHSGRQLFGMIRVVDSAGRSVVELRSDFVKEHLWVRCDGRKPVVSIIDCSSGWWRTEIRFAGDTVEITTGREGEDSVEPWARIPFLEASPYDIHDGINPDLNDSGYLGKVISAICLVLGDRGGLSIRSISTQTTMIDTGGDRVVRSRPRGTEL